MRDKGRGTRIARTGVSRVDRERLLRLSVRHGHLDELRAITEAREAFNERTRQLHESRGVPSHQSIVAVEGDPEIEDYIAQGVALLEREKAFDEKYVKPGADPHTID